MARHAGFGAVATITEKLVNSVVSTYWRNSFGARFFPLPQTVNLGLTAVSFSGIVELLPPKIELRANQADLITVHFSFKSTLRAQVSGQSLQTWAVQLDEAVDVGVITLSQNSQIVVAVDAQRVQFHALAITILSGPQLPPPILSALQSQSLADVATAFVRSLPFIAISPPVLSDRINFAQPPTKAFKDLGLSVFDWFVVDLVVLSPVVVKPMDHAITVAVNFVLGDGRFTTSALGIPARLVDLTKTRGPGSTYTYTINQRVLDDPPYEPFLVGSREGMGGDIATVINIDVIAFVIANQVSPQIVGTPVADGVRLKSIGVGYSAFQKPHLPPGSSQQDGLAINYAAGTRLGEIDGRPVLQTYRETYDLPTSSLRDDNWLIYAAQSDVDVPFWIYVAVVGLGITLAYALPVLTPVLGVGVIAGIDAISSIAENAEAQARQGIQRVTYPLPPKKPLPGLTTPDWGWNIQYSSFTSESIDLALNAAVEVLPEQALGVISPQVWPASNRQPFGVRLALRDDLERLGGDQLMLNWEVRRADTNQVVVTGTQFYFDLGGNGVSIPHHTPELYVVEAFIVRCVATRTLGSQVGEIWSGQQTIAIADRFDRRHKYVFWGPHIVHFTNAGTDGWWSKVRRSHIHRTAVSARCRELRHMKFVARYFDVLPFAWDALNRHREPLCEYCFFGGPDKVVPFPQEDWF